MRGLPRFALTHPVTVIITTIVAIFFGLYGLRQMGMENMPNVDIPIVLVSTTIQGASPTVVDNDVADPLESRINTVEGVKSLTSNSYEGRCFTIVEFELSKDIADAAADVRGKVSTAQRQLPDAADTPVVDKFNIADTPVMYVAVTASSGVSRTLLSDYADSVAKEQIQTALGVGGVDMQGLQKRQIRVWLDAEALAARNLTVSDVRNAVAASHIELPGGKIQTGTQDYSIRLKGEYETVDSLASLPVKTVDGTVIRLHDVARVEDGFEDRNSYAVVDGAPSILLVIRKQRGANEVALSDAVRERIKSLNATAPAGIELKVVQDNARFIRLSMQGVLSNIISGILLTAVIMFLFLRTLKSTLVTIVTMPVCLLIGMLFLWGMGFTINNMTTMGLSLVIGMVVDATTVVLENIHHHFDQGKTAFRASLDGTTEVSSAVVAGAATTVAVFLPVALMPGVVGRFFRSFGFTITVTILVSLLLSLTLTPFLCSRLLARKRETMLERILKAPETWLQRGYTRLLRWALCHRFFTLLFASATFAVGLFFASRLGSEFVPSSDEGEINVNFELNASASLEASQAFITNLINSMKSNPYVAYTYGTIGGGMSGELSKGTLNLVLIDRNKRPTQSVIVKELRKELEAFKGVKITLGRRGSNSAVSMRLLGSSSEELIDLANKITADLQSTPQGLVDVKTDVELNQPRIDVEINRPLADDLGVKVSSLASEVMTLFGGSNVGSFKDRGHSYDIRLQARAEDRTTPEKILSVFTRTNDGRLVRADGLVKTKMTLAPNVIKRYNRLKTIQITADVDGISPGEGYAVAEAAFKRHAPADGRIMAIPSGDAQRMQENFGYLFSGLLFALLLVYTVMAIQFESFIHPLIIMFAVPLMTSGAFGLLLAAHLKLSVMSLMGIIMLVGIVVNNAIILVDYANQLRASGLSRFEAMLAAGPRRLRPILMTSISTIAGAVPVALNMVEGGEIRQPMSIATIGGMVTSTLLTLLVIPVVYLVVDEFTDKLKARLSRLKAWSRLRSARRKGAAFGAAARI